MSIERTIHDKMIEEGVTLSVAESCTGGRLASRLTQISGASRYFLGGVIVYSNELKENFLGVSSKTLEKKGAVSSEVVSEMLSGLLKVVDSDYGIAITGIAGPDGGTLEKPVGTVWLAVGKQGADPVIWKIQGYGDRQAIIDQAVDEVLVGLSKIV